MTKFTQTYPTDLKYTEWQLIETFFPTYHMGHPRKWELSQIVNAILYVVRTGCHWRILPKDLPPWPTVYGYFRRWNKAGLWERINEALVKKVPVKNWCKPEPSAGILDRQSVKTSEGGEQRGVDVQWFETIKRSLHNRWCRLKLIWADAAYACIVDKVANNFGWTLDIVRRSDKAKGFELLPHRWIVERTFGWLGRYRRLSRDFERTVSSSESVVYIASIRRMLKLATN